MRILEEKKEKKEYEKIYVRIEKQHYITLKLLSMARKMSMSKIVSDIIVKYIEENADKIEKELQKVREK